MHTLWSWKVQNCRSLTIRDLYYVCSFPLVYMRQEIIVKQGPKAEVHSAIWLLSSQRFHYYVYLSIVSWQYQKY